MNRPDELQRELRAMFQRREEDIDTTYMVPERSRRRIKMLRLTYAGIGVVLIVAAGLTGATLLNDSDAARKGERLGPAASTTPEAAPEVDGKAPVKEELVGTWSEVDEAPAVRFRRNGTVDLADSLVGLRSPTASGRYTLVGDRVTFTGGCLDGQVWEVGLIFGYNPYEDALDVAFVEGGCGIESGTFWEMRRIET